MSFAASVKRSRKSSRTERRYTRCVIRIEVEEFKARVVELVNEVRETGVTFVIWEEGKPIAFLRPPTKKAEAQPVEEPK